MASVSWWNLIDSAGCGCGWAAISGAFGLAASGAQELTLGDDVCTAAQQLLTALTNEVFPMPG